MRQLLFALTGFIFLGFTEPNTSRYAVNPDLDALLEFYKDRHQHPEISLQEKETSKLLALKMRELGFDVTENFGGYGIVCVLKNGKGPSILYRTDMDALPMAEKTSLAYQSQEKTKSNGIEVGTMHSCGHDVHMTTWLGTAMNLVRNKKEWKGTLIMIGQPAEEIGAGAKMMLDEGLYSKFGVPDYGIGLHSSPTIPAGKVGFGKGFIMAATESVDIVVKGVGAHGAAPHMSIDPIVVSSMIIMDLQTIVSRSLKPIEAAVVTVGAIHGGTKHNIIPDEVTMKLTIRTYKEDVRQMVHKRIEEICRGIAIAAGLPEDKMPVISFPENFTPANYNNPEMVDKLWSSASRAIGASNVQVEEPQMVGEDFALYGSTKEKVPTVMFWLGTVPAERMESGNLPGLHSPYYFPDPEKSIETGVNVVSASLIDLFNRK